MSMALPTGRATHEPSPSGLGHSVGVPSAVYDERSDVLYVSLVTPPRPCLSYETRIEVLARFDIDTGNLAGMTVIDFAAQAIEARRAETSGSVEDESAVDLSMRPNTVSSHESNPHE